MLKTIEYLPQFKAEQHVFSHNEAVISITDPDVNDVCFQNASNILRLRFLDIEEPIDHPNFKPEYLFSSTQAIKIKEFVDTLPICVSHLVIHCFVGASRSAAVALALEAYTNGYLDKRDATFDANHRVLDICSTAFGLKEPVVIPPVNISAISTIFTF